MPLNSFFTYSLLTCDESSIRATIAIDPKHAIFEGHFPGNPVSPGVTQIEIIRQIISEALQKNLMLCEAKDIKYITPILPAQMDAIHLKAEYSIDSDRIKLNCVLSANDVIFTKIRGTFREE